ncbi:MAG: peptidyl-prolyl cis-trans isomerase, partial [Rhodospirillaceae bacterium]|nr:peptidyl-prolyl cis-trans isomerase [Rhodospirillaceae bacterium]
TAEQAKILGITDALVRRLTNTALYDLGAKDLGLGISDKVVLEEIKRSPEFFDESGNFNRDRFIQLLRSAGFSEETYVARVRHSMARLQYLSPIRDGVDVPPALVKMLQAYNGETRVLDLVRINHASITSLAPPKDDELQQFHQENSQFFMSPEFRKFSAIVLNTDDVVKGLDVSEEEIHTAFDEREDEFITPERRKLKQILVNDEAAAKTASDLISKGSPISDVAAKVGANGDMVDIGFFNKDQLLPEIQEAVFSLEQGKASQPIKTVLGWHVILVEKIEASKKQSFAEVKDKIGAEIKSERALDAIFEMSNKLEDSLASGATLEETASDLGLKTIYGESNIDGVGMDGKKLSLPFASEIVSEIFALEGNGDTPLTESKDAKGFFVARLSDTTPPSLKSFESVKEEVAMRWSAEASAKRAKKLADEITAKINDGASIGSVAKNFGFEVEETKPFDRNGKGLALAIPAEMVNRAFEMNVGGADMAAGTSSSVVAVLKKVIKAKENDEAALKQTTDQVFEDLRGDILDQLAASLRQRHSVKINQNIIDQAF